MHFKNYFRNTTILRSRATSQACHNLQYRCKQLETATEGLMFGEDSWTSPSIRPSNFVADNLLNRFGESRYEFTHTSCD
jgi:hypothetical protein